MLRVLEDQTTCMDLIGLKQEKGFLELEKLKLIKKIEKNEMVIPKCDRSNSIIEPMLTEQWFCDIKISKTIKQLF